MLWLLGCLPLQNALITQQMGQAQDFLADPGNALEQVQGPVWSWKYGWYRNMVLVGPTELAVFDPISVASVREMVPALQARFPDHRVSLVVYSHGHHDHIRGAAELAPIAAEGWTVLAQQNLVDKLAVVGDTQVLPPTHRVEDSVNWSWQGEQIELIYLPNSHSTSYLAAWLPQHGVLYTPDLASKRGGLALENDNFLPGVLRAQERLLELPATLVIPGHYELCTLADMQRYHDMIEGMGAIVDAELAAQGDYDVTAWDPQAMVDIQQAWREQYGDVPGFESAIITNSYYFVLAWIGGF
jgi:glyoxylase-like metal-dependent hydrolase (beta-lactamase superfamily II)